MAKRRHGSHHDKPVELEKVGFWEKTIEFIVKNKISALILLAVIIVGGTLLAVMNTINARDEEDASEMYDQAMYYVQYMWMVEDEETMNQMTENHLTTLNALLQTYPESVASVRARLYLGKVYFNQASQTGDAAGLNSAYGYYEEAKAFAKTDFYSALATLGMAICSEQNNQYGQAFTSYEEVITEYANEGFNPTALVGMARCKEVMSEFEAAIEYYKQVADEYPESLWARFAKGKIYQFTGTADGSGTVVSTGIELTTTTTVPMFILPE